MSFYCLDGRVCPMLAQWPLESDGTPRRAVYFYMSTEGSGKTEMRDSNSLCRVPDDNGRSWGAANVPRGATFYVEASDHANLIDVNKRLNEASENRKRALREQQAAGRWDNVGAEDVVDGGTTAPLEPVDQDAVVTAPQQFDPADANQDGAVTNKERKKHQG
ncbi:MAG: hypothetical protein AABN33_18420 [Acidobacteriota bacterium]